MCGIAGYVELGGRGAGGEEILLRMASRLVHRGPDAEGYFRSGPIGLAFRRLSIIDLESGDQPLYNEDGSLVLICNGEIYNYRTLRAELQQRGHVFRTQSDVEVLLHLYEEYGVGLLQRLNGQFAFALYDRASDILLLARDHFGINPLYYTQASGTLVFASEIKAILEHPKVERRVDLTGLDQVLTFPGLVGARTMFENIRRLESGHYLLVKGGQVTVQEYWDLEFPREGEVDGAGCEELYTAQLRKLFMESVRLRLQADVPVGFYLSGGLDSSLTAAAIHQLVPGTRRHAFAICFADERASEARYQQLMARHVDCILHEIRFDWSRTADGLARMIYHAECPVKETYNTCSLALSDTARAHGIKVVLSGEGADELFAGYIGYRFDQFRKPRRDEPLDYERLKEESLREDLWGDKDLFYERDYHAFGELKQEIYSPALRSLFRFFDCLKHPLVRKEKLAGRHPLHKRSYLDLKLRLADHLLMDHGDSMALANSVEARYPFLDIHFAELAARIPPDLKVNGFTEKYILRRMGQEMLPLEVLRREKFGWFAPGSPELLQQGVQWINDMLSPERLRRQGYFDVQVIESLKARYSREGFRLAFPYDEDLLMIVATFGLFLDTFAMPAVH